MMRTGLIGIAVLYGVATPVAVVVGLRAGGPFKFTSVAQIVNIEHPVVVIVIVAGIPEGVTVGVDSANDGKELGLAGVVADGSEEGAKVEGVDPTVVVAVNAAVGGEGAEVVADLELALQDVQTTLQVDLLLEDVEQGALDVVGKAVEAANAEGGSV